MNPYCKGLTGDRANAVSRGEAYSNVVWTMSQIDWVFISIGSVEFGLQSLGLI